MTLDDLKKETYKDLPVDKEHLDTESLRNQDLYAKYLDYKTNFEFYEKQTNTQSYIETSGNIMVENQTLKFMLPNHLT